MRYLLLVTFAILNNLHSTVGLSSANYLHRKIIPHRCSTFMCNSNDMNTADDGDSLIDAYLGPESDFDSMEAGCSIEDLGGWLKKVHDKCVGHTEF